MLSVNKFPFYLRFSFLYHWLQKGFMLSVNKFPFYLRFSFLFAFLGTLVSGLLPEHFWNGAYSPPLFLAILAPYTILYFSICVGLTRFGIDANPISNVSELDPYWRVPLLHGIGVISALITFWAYGLVIGIVLQFLLRIKKEREATTSVSIQEIKKNLQRHPQIKYEEGKNYLVVKPVDPNGFQVLLTTGKRDINVCALGWHETFKKSEEALNCFAFLLSANARLEVHYRGSFAYKYILQYKNNSAWASESEVGAFFYPFWKKNKIIYLQNNF